MEIILLTIGVLTLVMLFLVYGRFAAVQKEIKASRIETIQYINSSFKSLGDMVAANQQEAARAQDYRLAGAERKVQPHGGGKRTEAGIHQAHHVGEDRRADGGQQPAAGTDAADRR